MPDGSLICGRIIMGMTDSAAGEQETQGVFIRVGHHYLSLGIDDEGPQAVVHSESVTEVMYIPGG